MTFKENVSDTRNTKLVNLIQELEGYAIKVDVFDPHASAEEVFQHYGIRLIEAVDPPYNAIVVAVNHHEFEAYHADRFMAMMPEDPVLFDIKGMYDKEAMQQKLSYWRL